MPRQVLVLVVVDLVVLDFVVLAPGVAGDVPRAEGIEDTQRHRREAHRCPSTGEHRA